MILMSMLNQLAISMRLYETNDISLVELRHQTLVITKALQGELLGSSAPPNIIEYVDLLLDADGLSIICCYAEDLQRILMFLEQTISNIILSKTPTADNNNEQTFDDIAEGDLEDIHMMSEKEVSLIFEKISEVAPNNDKLAWRRLYKELQRHLIEYDSVNEQFLSIKSKRVVLSKSINEMREKMVNECVHPKTELVYKGDHVVCKFCEKRLKLT